MLIKRFKQLLNNVFSFRISRADYSGFDYFVCQLITDFVSNAELILYIISYLF